MINTFPKSSNGQPFLKLKNGKKLFFNIFIKKYGLDGSKTRYSDNDIIRRIRLTEFFKYFLRNFDIDRQEIHKNGKKIDILESVFYRMILIETRKNKLELLSFYHYK
ncbi:hypothetical protein HON22_02640 [Candidatus Peregrinibacteria bacterium]|nr:hypothetical protein [Candidatus Peregrinibacteria bacterium]